MKRLATLLLLACVVYLSSCGNGGNDRLPAVPQPDSVSKGSFVELSFINDSGTMSSFALTDLTVNNVAQYTLFANDIYNATDSLWHSKIQVSDLKMKQVAFEINLVNTSSTGIFSVVTNNSSLIDYTHGENITYAVYSGSTVEITQATYPIKGNFNLILYKNHVTYPATGTFSIFH